MSRRRLQLLVALGSALLFSGLYLTPILQKAEWAVYDLFLGLRPERSRSDRILFLDVDDSAVAQIGVWPWPRAVVGDGLLRLKEFDAGAVVFDIEYVDASSPGLDSVYLARNLPRDFSRSFGEISSNLSDLFNAMSAGYLSIEEGAAYAEELADLVGMERDALLYKVGSLARDNDVYLGQAIALYRNVWGTVNLQSYPLEGSQAERRGLAAQRFSYPVTENPGATTGGYVDVLAPIPAVTNAVRGAGFTNVAIDTDGVRRRIELARKVDDSWYLQLAFAPLAEQMGNPELVMSPRRLRVNGALMPDGRTRNLSIPLNGDGTMMIDWPKTNYFDSFRHISFGELARMDELEASLDELLNAFAGLDGWFLPDQDGLLGRAYGMLRTALGAAEEAYAQRKLALEEDSDEAFTAYLAAMATVREQAANFQESGAASTLAATLDGLASSMPDRAEALAREAVSIRDLSGKLDTVLGYIETQRKRLAEALPGRLCIIGWVGTGTTDIGVNPFHGEYVNVGTHAAVADTILAGNFIRVMDHWYSVVFALVFVPLLILGAGFLKPSLRITAGFGGTVAVFAGSLGLFAFTRTFFAPLGPALASLVAVMIRELLDFLTTEREKRFLRKAFGTYLSGEVVEQIIKDPSRLSLGGTKRYMTAMFTDVKGFSTISEQLDPEALVRLLNRYLSAMSDIVLEEGGTIDKYEGDAIISFFGAPLDLPDHAARTLRSAVLMKRMESRLNEQFMAEGVAPSPLLTRIGVNSGEMVVGNMGTERKMDYTIMGNAVNLAARLEGVNKQYGTWILASNPVIADAGDGFLVRQLDRVRVVGIHEPVRLYEVLDLAKDAPVELVETVQLFHAGLAAFEAWDWSEATRQMNKALELRPSDGPARVYLGRCGRFKDKPPEDGWDGVFNLTEK